MRHAVQRRDRSNAPALTLHDGSTANAARPLQRPGLMGLPPATWPIRSAPLPPGTWRETVSQSRRLRIRHRDPLPRRPWSPTLPPHTSPPAPPFPERPPQRATWSQGVPASLLSSFGDAASSASVGESLKTHDPSTLLGCIPASQCTWYARHGIEPHCTARRREARRRGAARRRAGSETPKRCTITLPCRSAGHTALPPVCSAARRSSEQTECLLCVCVCVRVGRPGTHTKKVEKAFSFVVWLIFVICAVSLHTTTSLPCCIHRLAVVRSVHASVDLWSGPYTLA